LFKKRHVTKIDLTLIILILNNVVGINIFVRFIKLLEQV